MNDLRTTDSWTCGAWSGVDYVIKNGFEDTKLDCCLCDQKIEVHPLNGWFEGHNASPLAEGRCCDNCNNKVVAERISRYMRRAI